MNYYLKLKSHPSNPAYKCVFGPQLSKAFEKKPNEIPPLGLRMQEIFQTTDIDVNSVSDTPLTTELPSWKLATPSVNFGLTLFKKSTTSDAVFKQKYLEECIQYKHYEKIFTDGSLKDDKVAAAAVSNRNLGCPSQLRLPNFSSIFTAELRAIYLALRLISKSDNDCFLIVSDSLSSLQAISSQKISHPLLGKIHDLHSELRSNGFMITFMWVPGHVGIRGNTIVDQAAKNALQGKIPNRVRQSVTYQDLKRRTNMYCNGLWQDEWSGQVNNKLFQVLPTLSDQLPMISNDRKKQTVLCRLHIGHSFITHSFLLKREDLPWCHACDTAFTVKHFLTSCDDLSILRRQYIGSNDLSEIFRKVSFDNLFEFLKACNLFNKI
jgi:ribonuclease HI